MSSLGRSSSLSGIARSRLSYIALGERKEENDEVMVSTNAIALAELHLLRVRRIL
jgi:hypothetical protein